MQLAFYFFLTAILYASVGFGGGSTYNALLVLADVDYRLLPTIALLCNIIVVSGGVYRFAKAGHIQLNKLLPWIALSVPAAWLGGFMVISEQLFIGLLGLSLLLCGVRMLWPSREETAVQAKSYPAFLPYGVGAGIGFLSGMVGIGGGIFLSPILFLLRWDRAKPIAGTCALFILVNSVAGLIGQLMKLGSSALVADLSPYSWLFPAVLIGGGIGSHLGVKIFNARMIERMTALLILLVAGRLLFKWTLM